MSEEALKVNDYDEAVIGKDYQLGRFVYSIEKIIELLMDRDNMTPDEACEYFDFNIAGAYMGDMTPLYVWTDYEDE